MQPVAHLDEPLSEFQTTIGHQSPLGVDIDDDPILAHDDRRAGREGTAGER
jgi:hypothetical protein